MEPVRYTHHLVAQLGRFEAAAAVLARSAAASDAIAADAHRRAARCSARLDASPLTDATADAVDLRRSQGRAPAPAPEVQAAAVQGSWARALRLDGMATQDVAAVEYADLLDAVALGPDVAAALLVRPVATLSAVHVTLTQGLLDADAAGTVRATDQSVHDGAEGRVLWHAPQPERLPGLLEDLARWLTGPAAGWPAAVVAGIVHERILQWQPFEAANGRLARTAARLVLQAHGHDPTGEVVFEEILAEDVLGYHAEVAATIRRRDDLVPWLERWADALAVAADAAVQRRVGARALSAVDEPAVVRDGRVGSTFTLRDLVRSCDGAPADARRRLRLLEDAGRVRAVAGSHGLVWRVVRHGAPASGAPGADRRDLS